MAELAGKAGMAFGVAHKAVLCRLVDGEGNAALTERLQAMASETEDAPETE